MGRIRQKAFTHVTWAHFAIPTPVVTNNVASKAGSARAHVATGADAAIAGFQIYDGEWKTFDNGDMNFSGPAKTIYLKPQN